MKKIGTTFTLITKVVTAHPAFSDVVEFVVADDIGSGSIGVSEGVAAHWVATQPCHSTLLHHITIHLRVDVPCLGKGEEGMVTTMLILYAVI